MTLAVTVTKRARCESWEPEPDRRSTVNQTLTDLPEPSELHATCAWCRRSFATIVQLIDHVDADHLTRSTAHAGRGRAHRGM